MLQWRWLSPEIWSAGVSSKTKALFAQEWRVQWPCSLSCSPSEGTSSLAFQSCGVSNATLSKYVLVPDNRDTARPFSLVLSLHIESNVSALTKSEQTGSSNCKIAIPAAAVSKLQSACCWGNSSEAVYQILTAQQETSGLGLSFRVFPSRRRGQEQQSWTLFRVSSVYIHIKPDN